MIYVSPTSVFNGFVANKSTTLPKMIREHRLDTSTRDPGKLYVSRRYSLK